MVRIAFPPGIITPADVALGMFVLCNALRVLAYVPQIVKISQDQQGATAISYMTWGFFGVSNISMVFYGLLVVHDWLLVAVFSANTICCLLILLLTAWKRALFKAASQLASAASNAVLQPAEDLATRIEHDLGTRPNTLHSRSPQLRVISGHPS